MSNDYQRYVGNDIERDRSIRGQNEKLEAMKRAEESCRQEGAAIERNFLGAGTAGLAGQNCTSAPPPKPEIYDRLCQLRDATDRLGENLTRLEMRLGPILRSSVPCGEAKECQAPNRTDLGGEIGEIANLVSRLAVLALEVGNRVEL